MRRYEVAYIADPDLDEEALAELEQRVQAWIEGAGGKVLGVDRWGRRRLAYPIRKKREGYYVFLDTELPPEASQAIERDLRLNENIMRYLIVLQNGR